MTDLLKSVFALFFVSLTLVACSFNTSANKNVTPSKEAAELRSLTAEERAQDFDALVVAIRENYGPLKYKEQRFGWKLEDLVQEYRPQALAAKSDAESAGVIKQLLTRLQDGHVYMYGQIEKNEKYSTPIFLTTVEDKVLVGAIAEEGFSKEMGIDVGDEVLEVDGKATLSYLPTILKYESMANPLTDKLFIFRLLSRPTYMTELAPQGPTVSLKIAKPDGSVIQRTVNWKFAPNSSYIQGTAVLKDVLGTLYSSNVQELIQGTMMQMGAETPFFMTPQAIQTLKIAQITPSETALKKHGLTDLTKTPKIYAGLYRFEGQNILLIRQAGYAVPDSEARIAWYKAVLEEYGPLADKLVLDQTHNPGGKLDYALEFTGLFAKGQTRGLVNYLRADRKWLTLLTKIALDPTITGEAKKSSELAYKQVESAYDKGLHLTETPVNLGFPDYLPATASFDKPILMLVDELAGSCGDIVPALMKDNKIATLFGERTIGLGGNIEPVITLPSSQITVALTRGLFFTYSPTGEYDMKNAVENNGVTPDIHYQHTVKDTRSGYVDYVKAFSKAAVELK